MKIEIILDSISPRGHRLTTFSCEYWRAILAEVNTHRALTRNSPSSRAIPVAKMIERIETDPAIPVSWPANESGMQATKNLSPEVGAECKIIWLEARDCAITYANTLIHLGLHKQVANRILEPWMHTKSLISATDWENFFHLRVHKDAQPDFQELAYQMLKVYLDSVPKEVAVGGWHIPFGDKMPVGLSLENQIRVAVARAARVSYYTQDGEIDVEKDLTLTQRLAESGHWSPAEHVAQCMDSDWYDGNFQGWKQYRKFQGGENRRGNLTELLLEYEKDRL